MSPLLTDLRRGFWPAILRAIALAVLATGAGACCRPRHAVRCGAARTGPGGGNALPGSAGRSQAGDELQAERQFQALVEACPDYAGPWSILP